MFLLGLESGSRNGGANSLKRCGCRDYNDVTDEGRSYRRAGNGGRPRH